MITTKRLFTLYMSATLLLILLPLNGIVKLDRLIFELRPDLIAHTFLLLPWMFVKPSTRFSNPTWIALGALYGAMLEFSHYFLPYRSFDLSDMVANTLGIFLSWGAYALWKKSENRVRKNRPITPN